MSKRIIIIHGRNTKPARGHYEDLQKQALIQGIHRVDPAKATLIAQGAIAIDFVYYGDINNQILGKRKKIRDTMTDRDPAYGNAPCIPHGAAHQALGDLANIRRFTKASYNKILRENKDSRWLDDAARALSTLSAITTATWLNTQAISIATADMGAYLMTRKVGSEVRGRLQQPLKSALKRGDDICLISHSMGCMVSYDVLWKFSRMSEYRDVQEGSPRVNLWVTLGCPLGEAGVKQNLYDGSERDHDMYPINIVRDWVNIAAKDDFVAHDATMKDDYRSMLKWDFLETIKDKKVYNCYAEDGVSYPHRFYGYLAHSVVGETVANWM